MSSRSKYTAGIVGGLVGGLVFGIMMSIMGMMPVIAALVKSDSVGVGWVIHLIISVIIGAAFAWWFGAKIISYGTGAGYGLLHGFIWWILGPLLIMPLMMGMGVQFVNAFTKPNVISLMGHLIFGPILGLVYAGMRLPKYASKPAV